MKKIITALSLLGIVLSGSVSAQTFTTQHVANGDTSIEYGSGEVKVHNNLRSTTAAKVVIDWHVVDTSTNLSASGAIWALSGICDNALCHGGSPDLFAGSVRRSAPYDTAFGTFYAWFDGANAPVGSVAWIRVRATDTATGGTTRILTFIANKTPTGISNITVTDDDIHLYPNPAGKNIIIATGDHKNSLSLDITGIDGKRYMSQKIVDKVTTLAIDNLSPGMYFACIRDENGKEITTKRFVHTQ